MDRLVWAGSITLRVGDWRLNVRGDTSRTLDAVEAYFAAHAVGRLEGPVRYSVRLGGQPDGTRRPLHQLFDGGCLALRTEDPTELMTALAAHVSEHVAGRDALLRVTALTLVDAAERAVLLPGYLRRNAATFERQLADAGLRVVCSPSVDLVPGTNDVVVPEVAADVDDAVLAFLPAAGTRGAGRGSVPPGRYPVRACVVYADGDVLAPLPGAATVPLLIDLLHPASTADMATAVATLSDLARTVEVRTSGYGHGGDLLVAVRRMFGRSRR